MTEVLSLHSGAVFKHAFSKPNIFREFVRDITGVDVNPAQIHTEYEYPERVGNVNIKYDIFAEDDTGRIIVEIQHIKEMDFFARFLYYHMIGIIEQVAKHDAYDPPRTVYTIVVLATVPRDGSFSFSWARHLMEIWDEFNRRHQIASHQLIFLNPRLVNDQTPATVKPWLELIKDSFDKEIDRDDYESPTFKYLIDEINRNTMSAEVSTELKDETAWDMAVDMLRNEGRREQQEQTARAMLKKGFDLSMVVEMTGLTLAEVEALATPAPTP